MADTNGPVFTHLQEQLGASQIADDLLQVCTETVDELLAQPTANSRPGMLLGKIQSGKTKAFIGVLALAFDNGYDHAVVFTKGTRALTRQTVARLSREFRRAIDLEEVKVYDIMSLPALSNWELQRKLIIVCKKEDDNLELLTEVLTQQYPDLTNKKFLLIDDEADLASIGYKRTENGVDANVIPNQLNDLRASLGTASFLQVTATPYALYLQPEDIVIPATQKIFEPIRPAFTKLVLPHGAYVGGEYYFEESKVPGTVASCLHVPVHPNELLVLRKPNTPQLDLLNVLTSDAIRELRRAIVTFIVAGTLRRWQQHELAQPPKRYSFLVHIEVSNAAHAWQEEIVSAVINRLRQDAQSGMAVATPLIQTSYDDLAQSVTAAGTAMPTLQQVLDLFPAALDGVAIQTVNVENDVAALLDESGQLELRNPLNIFIGGNILDRGITIDNVIGFYYGRNPQRSQQDTVLQHARMYGAREPHDLAVTRFYTTPDIHARMETIHQFESALWSVIEAGDHDQGVIFLRRDPNGQLAPCNPNKILLSRITTVRSNTRLIPVGFSTNAETPAAVAAINGLLAGVDPDPAATTYTLPVDVALQIIDEIERSLTVDPGEEFDFKAMRSALAHFAAANETPGEADQVTCMVYRNRDAAKVRSNGRLQDAPEGPSDRSEIFGVRGGRPSLLLYLQNGDLVRGWDGTPFYWPVFHAPSNVRPVIFSAQSSA